jgi:putative endonuclease
MEFFVYIIYSSSLDSHYVGSTGQLDDRLYRHNNSGSKATKKAKDWVLKYSEPCQTFAEAYAREMKIKNKKSRKYIEYLISTQNHF